MESTYQQSLSDLRDSIINSFNIPKAIMEGGQYSSVYVPLYEYSMFLETQKKWLYDYWLTYSLPLYSSALEALREYRKRKKRRTVGQDWRNF